MPSPNMITAADYADAMMVARRAKGWLFLLLLLMLLTQISVFFVARMTSYIIPDAAAPAPVISPATLPASTQAAASSSLAALPATRPADADASKSMLQERVRKGLWYVTAGINFLAIVLVIILAIDLLLIVNIMLVGRLVGVAQVTSAWVWCIILAIMLFPWQSVLYAPDTTGDFRIPGILYTWSELIDPRLGAKFDFSLLGTEQAILRWARFVGFPALSLLLLLVIQAKSSRGLRAALGESELDIPGEMTIS